jgi:hypothetical protein
MAGGRELNQAYRAYLHEAATVITVCYNGVDPDLSAMNTAKANLY